MSRWPWQKYSRKCVGGGKFGCISWATSSCVQSSFVLVYANFLMTASGSHVPVITELFPSGHSIKVYSLLLRINKFMSFNSSCSWGNVRWREDQFIFMRSIIANSWRNHWHHPTEINCCLQYLQSHGLAIETGWWSTFSWAAVHTRGDCGSLWYLASNTLSAERLNVNILEC